MADVKYKPIEQEQEQKKFQFKSLFIGKNYLKLLLALFILFLIIIIVWFAIDKDKKDFNREYSTDPFTDAFYFLSTMFGTFGYGDIYPKSRLAKWIVSCMHITVIFLIMNLYEHIFISNKAVKDMAVDFANFDKKIKDYEEWESRPKSRSVPNQSINMSNILPYPRSMSST